MIVDNNKPLVPKASARCAQRRERGCDQGRCGGSTPAEMAAAVLVAARLLHGGPMLPQPTEFFDQVEMEAARPTPESLLWEASFYWSPEPGSSPSCLGGTSIESCASPLCTSIRRGCAASATGMMRCNTPLA